MFAHPVPSSPAVVSTPSSIPASSTSPTRPSRLRGLNYLRNYTQHHLNHSSDRPNSVSSSGNAHPGLQRAISFPASSLPPVSEVNFAPSPSLPASPLAPPATEWLGDRTADLPPPPRADSAQGGNVTSNEEEQPSSSLGGFSRLMARHKSSSNTKESKKEKDRSSTAASGSHAPLDIRNFSRASRATSSTATDTTPALPAPPPTMTDIAEMSPPPSATRPTNSNTPGSNNLTGLPPDQLPTIKFIPHQDPRSNKPSLMFPATSRTLPHEDCVIRVGRFSEKDGNYNQQPGVPSANPVGFKSKVVSRRHCEFWCSQGQWYIKDVRSSSGTFLNHIRLSQPSIESRPFPVNDGDVVQLGIDFRGGEEMIFRCVKIRIECNRSWQKGLNNFNTATHKRLRALSKPESKQDNKKDSDTASTHTSECSICLMSVAPCQSLFVAPCSHVWHFKCIRPILTDMKTYPQFLCPNCRAVADLEADVDDPYEVEGWNADMEADASGSGPEEDSMDTTGDISAQTDTQDHAALTNGTSPIREPRTSLSNDNRRTIVNFGAVQPTSPISTENFNLAMLQATGNPVAQGFAGPNAAQPSRSRDPSPRAEDTTSPPPRASSTSPAPNPSGSAVAMTASTAKPAAPTSASPLPAEKISAPKPVISFSRPIHSRTNSLRSIPSRSASPAANGSTNQPSTSDFLSFRPEPLALSQHADHPKHDEITPRASMFLRDLAPSSLDGTSAPKSPPPPSSSSSSVIPTMSRADTAVMDSRDPSRNNGMELTESKEQTRQSDRLSREMRSEGPLTPRNDVGPFVFDGGDRIAEGRTDVDVEMVVEGEAVRVGS
ncbi:hypothetical protein MMC25_002644 [Agyrium rufum]|nr:hypothetical protein [Agyrium rufum]